MIPRVFRGFDTSKHDPGCFLNGRRSLLGNRDNLTEGFEGFSVISNDCNVFERRKAPCQATTTTSWRALRESDNLRRFPVILRDANDQ